MLLGVLSTTCGKVERVKISLHRAVESYKMISTGMRKSRTKPDKIGYNRCGGELPFIERG